MYVEGGNTFWLHHVMNSDKHDWTRRLKKACTGSEGAIYIGKSAGAIIAGVSMDTATWKVSERWMESS